MQPGEEEHMISQINLSDIINRLLKESNISTNPAVGQFIAAFIFFALSLIVGWIIYHVFEHYFSAWAKKTKTSVDDEIIRNVKKPVYFFVVLLGFYYGIDQLSILDVYQVIIGQIFVVAEVFLVAFIITRVINVLISWYAEKTVKQRRREVNNKIVSIFKKFLHAIVYLLAFVFVLHTFKIDLSGIVIGLGVGGIAIAFALQNVLGDAFSAFSIYFDRPFEVGDLVVVGDFTGTVTKIGMKSTRIQLLQGEEFVLSNSEIISSGIRNFKKMAKRRVEFIVRIHQNTPLEKLKKIPELIEKTIRTCSQVEFDMVHFHDIGSFSYNFEVVYYIKTGDYHTYLDTHEKVNYALKEVFEKEGIEFGFQGSSGTVVST